MQRNLRASGIGLVFTSLLILAASVKSAPPADHQTPLGDAGIPHAEDYDRPYSTHCTDCHALDLQGGLGDSCYQCHGTLWFDYDIQNAAPPTDHTEPKGQAAIKHKPGFADPLNAGCTTCHGPNLNDGFASSCLTCHGPLWAGGGPPEDHTELLGGLVLHRPGYDAPFNNGCTSCHGNDIGDETNGFCTTCHNPFSTPNPPPAGHHFPGRDAPLTNCSGCHGPNLDDGFAPSCFTCHVQVWPDPVPNAPPTADPNGPYNGQVGIPVAFDGSLSTDTDGTIVAYEWDFGDGSLGTGDQPSHTYAAAGLFTVALTVTDDGGLSDTKTTTVDIAAIANLPPDVDPGGPYSGVIDQPVQFDASGTLDPEQDTLVYMWTFEGDTQPIFGATATHSWNAAGTYTATLSVTDGVNAPVLVDVQVEITDTAPPPPPPPLGDTWLVKAPFGDLSDGFFVTFEEFAGILVVESLYPDGTSSMGIGMEWDGVIYWMDMTYTIYFGNLDRDAGTMSGVAFFDTGVAIWFGERAS